jgi:hypothetical protein
MDVARISSRRVPTIVLAVSMVLTSSSGAVAGEGKGQQIGATDHNLTTKVSVFIQIVRS